MSIEKLRQMIYSNNFEPIFEPNKWEDWEVRIGTNCYAYALDTPYPETDGVSYLVGEFSGHMYSPYLDDEQLICNIRDDMASLGLEMTETTFESTVSEQSYKIAICNARRGFHFLRQDRSGKWSHKKGWDREVTTLDCSGCEITDPKKANLGEHYVIGYFLIKRKNTSEDSVRL